MNMPKRILSLLLCLAVLLSLSPALFSQSAAATYCEGDALETVENGIPLRNSVGQDFDIVGRIDKEGTVVVVREVNAHKVGFLGLTTHYWYRVSVTAGGRNGITGDFWIWEGNLRDHEHNVTAGRCTSVGCGYERKRIVRDTTPRTLITTHADVPVRDDPYADGNPARRLDNGQLVETKGVIEALPTHFWYVTQDNKYIYEDNLRMPTQAEYTGANNTEFDRQAAITGGGLANFPEFGHHGGRLVSEPEIDYSAVDKLPCAKHSWSRGECTVCGAVWNVTLYQSAGTYTTARDNVVAREIPYEEGAVMHTYGTKGTLVELVGYGKNAHHNTWYKTKEGWWIYAERLADSSLKSVSFSVGKIIFSGLGETKSTKLNISPASAVISSIVYSSSNAAVATVDANGVITARGAGNATITAKVTAREGTVKTCTCEVSLAKLDTLDKWTCNNEVFNYRLALECSEYMCLAYPTMAYTSSAAKDPPVGSIDIYQLYKDDAQPRTPEYLVKLMKSRGWSCQVADTYTFREREDSPYMLAVKEFNYNGAITPVVFVVIEGTGGYPGWEGNMMMTGYEYVPGLTEHATFSSAADKIVKGLRNYISGFSKSVKPLVVITGHSRGGAVANLLARRVNALGMFQKVYAYTFATPNATTAPAACNYIFNICNTDDFVTYIPLRNNWGFKDNGTTCNFSSYYNYRNNSIFASRINSMLSMSSEATGHSKPDYNYEVMHPYKLAEYLGGKFRSVAEYYTKNNAHAWTCDGTEAFYYMYYGLARAAENGYKTQGMAVLGQHILCAASAVVGKPCAFTSVSNFFVANAFKESWGLGAFRDSHIAMTYHAAMLAGCYNSQGATLFEEPEDPAPAPLEEEAAALRTFFTATEENRLAMAEAGWDAEDPATWTGVTWDSEGHITSLDLSYMDFAGWLNLSPLTGLREALLDGNRITSLGVTGCGELVNLSCMCNEITVMDVAQCAELTQLNCAFNQLSSLSVSGLSNLQELNCCHNAIANLDLTGASALDYLECSGNELTGLDVSTNTALSTLFCGGNKLCSADSPELVTALSAMGRSLGRQQYDPSFAFDETELELLNEFADTSGNREKLGWDPADPWSWTGVEWDLFFDEMGVGTYHARSLDLSGLELEGALNLPSMEHLESLSCAGSKLSGLYLSGCAALTTVDCTESGIGALDVSDCAVLDTLALSGNYLDPGASSSELSRLGLQTGLITWENQHVPAQADAFDATERAALIRLLYTADNTTILGWNEEKPGDWYGVVWVPDESGVYRVNKLRLGLLPLEGDLDLTGFDYLEEFDFSCSRLGSVILPDTLALIPDYAFAGSSLESVTLPEGIAGVGASAFQDCASLRAVLLPATLQSLGDAAFKGCAALTDAVFLGDEPLLMGEEMFTGCAAGFRILVREEKDWTSPLPEDFPALETVPAGTELLLLADRSLTLEAESAYTPEEPYTGCSVSVTVISLSGAGRDVLCLLTVYGDSGQAVSTDLQAVSLAPGLNTVLFRSVDLLFAGESGCEVGCFLLDKETLLPLTEDTRQILLK